MGYITQRRSHEGLGAMVQSPPSKRVHLPLRAPMRAGGVQYHMQLGFVTP